ncbi:unnamed protein product [Caenorhabditis bovis]|uniref:Splicing factor 45 n=1 Tax=Caenorhabditis bovis TaxID=2654633 RepID=A0A8S1F5R5_9PELO|nr:unnamed protein product [Caenorhabditis bovis]
MYNDDDDDIPTKEPETKKSKTMDSVQLKFLQSQIAQKRTALQAAAAKPKTAKISAPPPVIDLAARNRALGIGTKVTMGFKPIKANPVAENISFLPKSATDDSFMMFGEYLCKNEYQVSVPNEYEKMARIIMENKMKEKAAKEEAKRLAREQKEEDKKRSKGAAIAPPTALLDPEPPTTSESKSDEDRTAMPPPTFLPAFGKSVSRGLGIAANIMKKQGYREGLGLGKNEQGISKALVVEKSGLRGGQIVGEETKLAPTFATNSMEAVQNATKVLILANLISLDELKKDYENIDEFGDEIKEEMQKCGQVANVLVHVNDQQTEEQQVRVFVEFTNNAQAIKAFVVMNGRFFGGRSVLAGFYNVDDYNDKNYNL